MILKNKKTGEIREVQPITIGGFRSLAELNEEWEDYEEPKEYWCIDWTGGVNHITVLDVFDSYKEKKEEIGNYFETKEEAEKAVEKLKAWKRLKDKGFGFINFGYKKLCKYDVKNGVGNLQYQVPYYDELEADLDLLFGGEE